jgi:DNA-binding protein YbaB
MFLIQILAIISLLNFSEAFQSSSTQRNTVTTTTSLNLFGGNKGGDGGDKKPGMMDQLAMFKKAQEMAQKKQKIDQELQKMEFSGSSSDGNVKVLFKFVPVANPMDPNPDYEATSFTFNEEWFAGASPEEISATIKAAFNDGVEKTNVEVAKKYAILQEDLMAAFGGATGSK